MSLLQEPVAHIKVDITNRAISGLSAETAAVALTSTLPLRYLLIDDEKRIAACVDPAEASSTLWMQMKSNQHRGSAWKSAHFDSISTNIPLSRFEVHTFHSINVTCTGCEAHLVLAKAKEEKVDIVAVNVSTAKRFVVQHSVCWHFKQLLFLVKVWLMQVVISCLMSVTYVLIPFLRSLQPTITTTMLEATRRWWSRPALKLQLLVCQFLVVTSKSSHIFSPLVDIANIDWI